MFVLVFNRILVLGFSPILATFIRMHVIMLLSPVNIAVIDETFDHGFLSNCCQYYVSEIV